jgi:hypothetical protein
VTDYSGQYFIKTEQDGGFSKIYRADTGVMSGVYEAHLIDPTSFEPLGPKLIRRSVLEEMLRVKTLKQLVSTINTWNNEDRRLRV